MLASLRNPRVKDVVKLRNRRYRDRQRRFVVEGRRELACAQDAGFPVQTVYYCEAFHSDPGDGGEAQLLHRFAAAGSECVATSQAVFEKMSYRRSPDGLLGVAAMPSLALDGLALGQRDGNALWLVAAGVEKPGNLGAMLRCVDAVGGNGLLLADPVADVFNPNVVRASVGALFAVAVAVASAADIRAWLNGRGVRVFAASPDAATIYTEPAYDGDVAFVVGSESKGLNADWLAHGKAVRIPMFGRVDSINAATAAAVLLFEARRRHE